MQHRLTRVMPFHKNKQFEYDSYLVKRMGPWMCWSESGP